MKNIVYRIVEDMVDRQIRMNNDIVPEGHLDTTTALIYDSVNAFALALNELTSVQQVIPSNLDCDEHRTWSHGNSLMNYMKVSSHLPSPIMQAGGKLLKLTSKHNFGLNDQANVA